MNTLTTTSCIKGNSALQMRQWDDFLKTGLWYASLPEPLQHAMLNMATTRNLSARQCLLRRGDDSKGMYAILEGAVRASAFNGPEDKSSEMILLDLPPGNWFGEITLFDRRPRTHDAHAVGATKLLYFSQDDLEYFLKQAPQYWRDFGRLLAGKLRVNLQTTEELMCLPARARLSSRLLEIASGFGWMAMQYPTLPGHKLKVSQSDLAMMLGYSRQTVNNLLVELQDKKWLLLRRSAIEITDPAALQREARGLAEINTGDATKRCKTNTKSL